MTERGNPDNLRAAARRKHRDAVARAERALHALVRDGEPVNFRAVARLADCSPDFLYRTPGLRTRIEQLRSQPRRATAPTNATPPAESSSMVIRELAAQLADVKRRHRDEVTELDAALAAAHGELLALHRRHATGAQQDGELHDPDGTLTSSSPASCERKPHLRLQWAGSSLEAANLL